MFNKKIKQEIEFLKLQVESQGNVIRENWKYIQALLDAEKQNRKDLNAVIAKINQMKTKGKK